MEHIKKTRCDQFEESGKYIDAKKLGLGTPAYDLITIFDYIFLKLIIFFLPEYHEDLVALHLDR